MPYGFDRSVIAGIGLLAAMMTTIAVTSYVNTRDLRDGAGRATRSRDVLDAISTLRADTRKLQADQRAYLFTGFEDWIKPFEETAGVVRADAAELIALTQADPNQQIHARNAEQQIETGIDGLNAVVKLRGGVDGHNAVIAQVRERGRQSFMDPLLATLAEMDRIERQRLEAREEAARKAYDRGVFYEITSAVLGLLALGMFVSLLHRSVRIRVRDANRLAEQRELLSATLASIGDAVIATNASGHVTFLNSVAEKLTGWTQAESQGMPLERVFQIVNEATRVPIQNPAARALKEGVIVGLANHTILIAKDGSERPIDDSAAPIQHQGVLSGVVLVFRDITDKKEAERERERLLGQVDAERRLLEAIFDALPVGAVVAEPGGRLVRMNRANEELWGGPPPTNSIAEYRPWVGWWPDTGRRIEPEEWALARVLTSGEPVAGDHVEIEQFHGGGRRNVIISGAPVRDAHGRLVAGVIALLDVTERERAEKRLRESEKSRQLALEGAELGAWHLDPETGRLTTDRRFRTIFGIVGDTIDYEPAVAVIHPEDQARVREAIAGATRPDDPAPYTIEYRVVHPDGSVHWVFAKGIANFEPSSSGWKFVSLDGIIADITDRKKAESERERLLRQVEAERGLLADIFRHAPSFMTVLLGPDHVFQLTNDRYLQLIGGRDVIGRSTREALPEVEGQGFFELLDGVYRTGEPYIGRDHRVVLVRGGVLEERLVDFVYQPLRDAEGAVSGIIVQGIDITDRKRAEEGLTRITAESERRKRLYETALSNTPDFVYVFGLDYRFTYANEALLRMWGRSWGDAIGKTCLEIGYEPWHAEMHEREIDQVKRTKAPVRGEVPFNGTNGRRIYDYIFVPVLGADGEVEAVAGTTRDVTERKILEDALRENDRKKDDFIALLAHELRNPLAPIRNGLQVLRLSDDVAIRDRTQLMMTRQLTHLVRIVDDLLDISRIGQHKMQLRRERVVLSEVVSSAVETARPVIEEAGHSLTITLPPGPVFLDADLTRLSQVFSNLLTNSAKYTPRGGKIWLSAELGNEEILVSIRDNGIGIPAAALPKLFDMFSQIDRPLERSTGGLGIGLALVKGLVEMHGGTVAVKSAGQGQGSTFTVTLPVLPGPTEHAPVPEVVPCSAEKGQRILVVDDNRDAALSMAMMLDLLGNEVHTAHDGLEAIKAAERFRPEVILMDLGMPKINGLEATRLIHEQPWGKEMLIIALTGWGQEGDKEQSREAGCDGHLVKPVSLADLQKLLVELHEKTP